ncbi:hypothetical protein [Streptomyces sp. NPDC020607]|uniref:hypothetical protein n=1 Tax=Streptomyces sp. NPDC020607 TaxID=3365082 RepID=UPI0037B599B1
MTDTTVEETLLESVEQVSIARLHGLACWDCGAVTRTLVECGSVRDEDGQVRPKKTCGCAAGSSGPTLPAAVS